MDINMVILKSENKNTDFFMILADCVALTTRYIELWTQYIDLTTAYWFDKWI